MSFKFHRPSSCKIVVCLWIAIVFCLNFQPYAVADDKPRVIVLSDIGGDPDDQQSMIRLLLYSNELDIEGLIATSLGIHGYDTKPELITHTISKYGTVRKNLLLHKSDYPSASSLYRIVKSGNPVPGIKSAVTGPDTEGSKHIIAVVDQEDDRPVWVIIWGGATDLAHALVKVRQSRSSTALATFTKKLRVYAIGDQDGTGKYLRKEFPNLFFIYAQATSAPFYSGVPRGMYQNESGKQKLVKDTSLVSANWVKQNVITSHGVLGAMYPSNAVQTPRSTYGVKEGDTPSFLYLLSLTNGLSDPQHPSWGSWGGRFKGSVQYTGAEDEHWSKSKDRILREKWTIARFRSAYQNDFQARMDWCLKSFINANHEPVAGLGGDTTKSVVFLTAVAGSTIELDAFGSSDPDGDHLAYSWSFYKEVGTVKTSIPIRGNKSRMITFTLPTVTTPRTLHVILDVSDNGIPSLHAYRRIVVIVSPH